MSMHFFCIPAREPAAAQDELNRFLGAHRVAGVERQLVQAGAESYWALCVTVAAGPAPLPQALKVDGQRGNKLDYKQLLSEADFAVYADLRVLRKQLAEQAGVPVYAVFSNEQLAAMVQQRVASQADLGAIEGVGAARQERYGAAFIDRLRSAWGPAP